MGPASASELGAFCGTLAGVTWPYKLERHKPSEQEKHVRALMACPRKNNGVLDFEEAFNATLLVRDARIHIVVWMYGNLSSLIVGNRQVV